MEITKNYHKVHEVASYKEGFTSELFFTQELIDMNLADNIIKNDNMCFKETPMKVYVSLDYFMPITIELKETVVLKSGLREEYSLNNLHWWVQIAREFEYARREILSHEDYKNMREVLNVWAKLSDTLKLMKLVNQTNFNFSELTKELTFAEVRDFKGQLESILLNGES
jgi:hypothetical protein